MHYTYLIVIHYYITTVRLIKKRRKKDINQPIKQLLLQSSLTIAFNLFITYVPYVYICPIIKKFKKKRKNPFV